MTGGSRAQLEDILLIEVIAKRLRVDAILPNRWNTDGYTPHLLLGGCLIGDYTLRSLLLLREPWRLTTSTVIVLGLLIGLFGAFWMRNGYVDALGRLELDNRPAEYEYDRFTPLTGFRTRVGLYLIGLILIYYQAFVNIGGATLFTGPGAGAEAFRHFVAYPLAYVPLVIDVGVLFLGIHYVFPRRLKQADLEPFFFDPRNMGGFAPIGQLLKRSYYIYTVGLLSYFAFAFLPSFLSTPEASPYESGQLVMAFFILAWAFGLVSISYSIWMVHRLLKQKKEQHFQTLEKELQEAIENPYNITEAQITNQEELDRTRQRLEEVRTMKEMPVSFSMASKIISTAVLPQVLNTAVYVILRS